MEVSATDRFAGVSPRKVRLILHHVVGKPIDEAMRVLQFLPSPHAKLVSKIVKSAAANAENNFAADPDQLYVKRAIANEGRRLRRYRPAARGRAHSYVRRTSHITITVDERGS
jgi:large subunit ribosomal protein L22